MIPTEYCLAGELKVISGFATQGSNDAKSWVKEYRVWYSSDGKNWRKFRTDDSKEKVFSTSSDCLFKASSIWYYTYVLGCPSLLKQLSGINFCCKHFWYMVKYIFPPTFFQIFRGNSDANTQVTNSWNHRVVARYVRFLPQSYRGYLLCMRVELFGCTFYQCNYISVIIISSFILLSNHC